MSRLLYERHVPADPLLAPLFANMPPDQPQRLAAWLAEALGGPSGTGEFGRETIGLSAAAFTEEHRARWAALTGRAADESGLPADPAFRAAFSSCADWASRTALAGSQAGDAWPPVPTPRWEWGPGGPPAGTAPARPKTRRTRPRRRCRARASP